MVRGHATSWLDGITLENIKLFLSHDPAAALQKAGNALDFRWARNLKVRGLEVVWESPGSDIWKSALAFEDIKGLETSEFAGRQGLATAEHPAVVLHQVENARFWRNRALPGAGIFFSIRGERSRGIDLEDNDLREARIPCRMAPEVKPGAVKAPADLDNGRLKGKLN